MAAEEWLYARVHHTGHQDGELLLTDLVPSWVEAAEHAGVRRWFFLRYADASGPHLRVRFRGTPDALDGCWEAGRALWREHVRPPDRGEVHRLHPLAEEGLPGSGSRRLSLGLYGREHHYYGSPPAVDIAEEVFQASSELCLDAVRATGADRTARAHLAVRVMRSCLGSLGRRQRERVWRLHWGHWTGVLAGDPASLRETERIAERWPADPRPPAGAGPASARAAAGAAVALPVASSGDAKSLSALPAAADALGRDLADGVRRALAVDPAAVASRLLLMQLHMTLNRLGFLPLEEAVLGRVAARAERSASPSPPPALPGASPGTNAP
ncbi:thiopeptide-type bacteriocin biosynthesis protein [Streptomyces sp. WMMC940]|uniref:thiopeptide-type bacteriocin biosynthesis protein n=1 Tax=Streptomyces sp. WMMC940 TaxID=3015153 RepID=UPI0022B635F6|nr:thiopeptide-type bacteriocin biosynthesis protein [Streptomyces sp. WMMC940]MCZ7459968.1 thiopeptide-type bacteriocin biosynthesis protein [Streptomyces sp. WMMC940]